MNRPSLEEVQAQIDAKHCWHCGYSMIGWPTTICPECGHGPDYYFRRITTGRVLRGKVAKVLLWVIIWIGLLVLINV